MCFPDENATAAQYVAGMFKQGRYRSGALVLLPIATLDQDLARACKKSGARIAHV